MAVIAGARTWHQIRATVRAGFMPVMKVSWITSPIALAFAQKFLPEQTWVPFFNIVAFCIGTYINTHTKKKRLAALRKRVSCSILAIKGETNTKSSIMVMAEAEAQVVDLMTDSRGDISKWADIVDSWLTEEPCEGRTSRPYARMPRSIS